MIAWFAYLLIAVGWGTTFAAITVSLESFTPLGTVAVRMSVAGLIAYGIGRLRKEDPLPKEDRPWLLLSAFMMFLFTHVLMAWAQQRISSGLAAVLISFESAMLIFFDRERLNASSWMGLGVAFLGACVLVGWKGLQGGSGWGVMAMLACDALWSGGTVIAKKKLKGGPGFRRAGVQMLTAGLPLLCVAGLQGKILAAPLSSRAIYAMAYLIVVGSILAFSAYAYLIQIWPMSRVSTYAYANPVVGVLTGCLFLGEDFGPRMAMGASLVLLGIGWMEWRRPKPMTLVEGGA
jgi:drug/metabolite transporter (DMT)-like permease